MEVVVQNKINSIKALSKKSQEKKTEFKLKTKPRVINDNLSKSIRNSRDAEIFKQELKVAFATAKK